jgi:ATP sulfurylase
MIWYEFDMASAASSRVTGVEVALGTNGDELGVMEDEVAVEVEETREGRDEASDEEKDDEGAGEEVGMADSVVGKSVTVINVPEAAGALRTVAESRGRIVEARWRQ